MHKISLELFPRQLRKYVHFTRLYLQTNYNSLFQEGQLESGTGLVFSVGNEEAGCLISGEIPDRINFSFLSLGMNN